MNATVPVSARKLPSPEGEAEIYAFVCPECGRKETSTVLQFHSVCGAWLDLKPEQLKQEGD